MRVGCGLCFRSSNVRVVVIVYVVFCIFGCWFDMILRVMVVANVLG